MKLYLSSEDLENKKDVIEEWKKQNGNKILVIPNAKDYKDTKSIKEKIAEKTKCLIEMGFEIKVLDLKKYFHKEKKLVNDIKDYRCFYVMGGNVFVPHYKSNHKESAMIDEVVQYLEENKIAYQALRDGEVMIENVKGK